MYVWVQSCIGGAKWGSLRAKMNVSFARKKLARSLEIFQANIIYEFIDGINNAGYQRYAAG